jgi:glycosyltransferase involved in cell wall biosynthesis
VKVVIALNAAWNLLNFRSGLIKALVADGHTVLLAAPSDEHVPALVALGARFVDVPMHTHGTNPLTDLALLWRFARLLQRERPDVLLAYTAKPNVYGSLAARWLGVPVVNNIAGLGSVFIKGGWLAGVLKGLYRVALARSHCVFFQNPDDLQLFLDHRLVAHAQTALLPGSGVDLQKFRPAPLPCLQSTGPAQSADPRRFVFLLVARMLKDKGVEEYVQAARSLKARHPQVECALLGFVDGDNPTAISAAQMQAWVSEGVVSYWGTSTDVREELARADCVVLPSYREGTPRTLLEAAAMARPLVATDVPGCREVVRHGINGLLCAPRDAQSLAEQMAAMLNMTDDALQQMATASRQWVQTYFDEQIVIDRYRQALADLDGDIVDRVSSCNETRRK